MALHNSRPTVEMIVTSDRIAITIKITTKKNEQEMIAVEKTREIDPTPKRAVRAAQVVKTTETVHTSTMRKRSTRDKPHTMSLTPNHTRKKKKRTHKTMQHNRKITKKTGAIGQPMVSHVHCF
jgi:hypothetical protein